MKERSRSCESNTICEQRHTFLAVSMNWKKAWRERGSTWIQYHSTRLCYILRRTQCDIAAYANKLMFFIWDSSFLDCRWQISWKEVARKTTGNLVSAITKTDTTKAAKVDYCNENIECQNGGRQIWWTEYEQILLCKIRVEVLKHESFNILVNEAKKKASSRVSQTAMKKSRKVSYFHRANTVRLSKV